MFAFIGMRTVKQKHAWSLSTTQSDFPGSSSKGTFLPGDFTMHTSQAHDGADDVSQGRLLA